MKMIIKKQPKVQPAGWTLGRKNKKKCQPYLGLDIIRQILLKGEGQGWGSILRLLFF